MAVEVATHSVVVLGGAGVSVVGEDLGIARRHSGVERVVDSRVAEYVRVDVVGDAGGSRDPRDQPVAIARTRP